MVTTTIRVDGLRQLGLRMRKLSTDIAKKVSGSATGAGARLVKDATVRNIQSNESKSRDSVETGLLLDSVIVKKLGKKDTTLTSEHIVTFKKKVYPDNNKNGKRNTRRSASALEFGTVNMPAEPNLRNALENNKTAASYAIRDKLAQRIAKEERK